MKKLLLILMVIICTFAVGACESRNDPGSDSTGNAAAQGEGSHRIGVIVYNTSDEEVLAFRDYLKGYIEEVFPNVTFIYSDSIATEEEELAFIQNACNEGVEGFLSFLTNDLKEEVDLCAANKAYYILASGTVSDKDFKKVEDNPYFIGEIGPGKELEYTAGADMAEYFAGMKSGSRYFVLSGGAALGNEMHLQRTKGVLDKLQEEYGVSFDRSSTEIALSKEPVYASAGDLTVCVMPGYVSREEFFTKAKEEYEKDRYDIVLSVLPISDMADVVRNSCLGLVDCYSTRNLQLFNRGQLCYVAGKYGALVGPSFAAMYNAVTGHADDFREDGKAFRQTQGFWKSGEYNDYVEKYAMANSVVKIAYNYEDLEKVLKIYNPEATLEDLKALISACSYEDALRRRGE